MREAQRQLQGRVGPVKLLEQASSCFGHSVGQLAFAGASRGEMLRVSLRSLILYRKYIKNIYFHVLR